MTEHVERPVKVLVVDDESQIRRALRLNLGARSYEVFEAESGERAIAIAAEERPDVVLLDLGLGDMDGIMVIEALRGWTTVPVIVITARDDERSKVLALDAGADDYVTKPFGMAELLARIRAALRRSTPGAEDLADVQTAHFRLDLAGRRAFVGDDDHEVRLTPIEWTIVVHLVRNPERLVTYKQLIEAAWDSDHDPDQDLLRAHMGRIRRKLEADPSRPVHFITDSGMGYRFAP